MNKILNYFKNLNTSRKIILLIIFILFVLIFVRVGCQIFSKPNIDEEEFKRTSIIWRYDYSDWKRISEEERNKLAIQFLEHYGEEPDKLDGPWQEDYKWLVEHTTDYYQKNDKEDKVAEAMDKEIQLYNETIKAESMAKLKASYEKIKKGMSQKEVRKIMGKPEEIIYEKSDQFGHVEVWVYTNIEEIYTITFSKDKVVKKTRS